MTLDDIRAAQPALGFALYALEPGGPMVLEVMAPDGQLFRFDGPTEAAVLHLAFPPSDETPSHEPDTPEQPEPSVATDIFS